MADELKVAGLKLKIDGAAQFESDLKICQKQSAALKQELTLLDAQTTSTGKGGVDYLRNKSQLLTQQIQAQSEKTRVLKGVLEEMKQATDVDAAEVEKLEGAIRKSEIETAKLTRALSDNNDQLAKVSNTALAAGKEMEAMGNKMKASGDKIAGIGSKMSMFVTAPIVAAAAASVKLASDFQESLNKVDVAFQSDSKEVKDWSQTSLRSFGLAKGTALDMVATYGDMATGMGFATDEAAKMGMEIVGRAADMASFKNISIDIANTALTSVFTGETESLKKLGIVMTETNLISYALANGYAKEYKEMSQKEKVQLRLAYVMEMSNNSAGDFARTIDGTANQSRLFTESLKELGETFGEELLPVVTPVIKQANAMLMSFGELDGTTKKLIIGTALLAAATGPLLFAVGKGIGLYGTLTAAKGAHAVATAATTSAVVAETTAVNGLAAAQGTAAIAGTGLAASLGPIALIAGATVAIIAGADYIIKSNFFKITGGDMDACAESAARLSASQDALDSSTSSFISKIDGYKASFEALSIAAVPGATDVQNYADALASADEKISEWDGGIQEAQDRISGLAALVAEESREYTEAERAEITELIGVINEYTKAKEDLYATHLQTLAAIAANEKDMSAESAAEYNKQAQEGFEELQKLADAAYAEAVEKAIERYGVEGALNKEAYQTAIENAQSERDTKIATAKESAEEVIQITANTYAKQNESGVSYLETLTQLKNDEQAIKLERNKAIVAANEELAATEAFQNADAITKWQMICAAEAEINEEYDQKIIDADKALAEAQADAQADQAAALVAAVQTMADAGIAIDESTLAAVNAYLEAMGLAKIEAVTTAEEVAAGVTTAFEGYHGVFYGLGVDAINGLIEGMNSKGPDLTAQAETDAANIEKIYRKKLDTHSPSKVLRKVGNDAVDGVIIGMMDKSSQLKSIVGDSADMIVDGFSEIDLPRSSEMSSIALSRPNVSNVSNVSTANNAVTVSFAGANFIVRKDSDIDAIGKALADNLALQRKAVGA